MSESNEWRECQPTDGLYQLGHSECESCSRRARQTCQVFAIYRGIKDYGDMVEDVPEFEPIKLEDLEDDVLNRIKKAKGGW